MAMANDSTNSMRSSACLMFLQSFSHFQRTFDWSFASDPVVYLQSDPRSHYICVLALICPLVECFALPIPNFRLIRAVSAALCYTQLSIATDIILLEAWSTFDPHYLVHFVMQCILFYCYPIKRMHLITQFYGKLIVGPSPKHNRLSSATKYV